MKFLSSFVLRLLALAVLPLTLASAAPKPVIGEMAPNFELTLFDGSKVKLEELRGNVVVLNFWATWCVPCRDELPTLDIYYKLRQKNGLRVYAIATEDSVSNNRLKKLFEHLNIPAVRKIKGPYGVMKGVPTNFIIDRKGVVRYAKAGAFDLDALNRLLVPLLNEKP